MPRCQLRVSDIAVTDSARFCGGGFDSFLGFDCVVLITLALHVFEYFSILSPKSLRSLRILASLRVTHCDSLLLAYPHVFLTCGTFLECRLLSVGQGYSCVGVDRHVDYSADSSPSLAQYGFVGGFLPNFAIFALVSVLLGKFNFSSLPSFGVSNAFLCQLSLPIHLFLSPLVLQFLSSVSQPILAAPS